MNIDQKTKSSQSAPGSAGARQRALAKEITEGTKELLCILRKARARPEKETASLKDYPDHSTYLIGVVKLLPRSDLYSQHSEQVRAS
jgi:hypothetical protein